MRVLQTLCAVALVVCCGQTVLAQWPDSTGGTSGKWWMEANGKILDRPGGQLGLPLITNEITNDVLLTSDQITDLGTAPGAEIKLGSYSAFAGIHWDASVQFARWDESHNDYTFVGPDLESPFFQGLDPDLVNIEYRAEFVSVDTNWRKAVLPGLTFLTGPRYFQLKESMLNRTETTIDTITGPFLLNTASRTSTKNSAIGWQIGLEYNQPMSRDVYVQGFIKTAGLLNQANVDQREASTIADLTIDSRSKDTGMFIGTVGGRLYCALRPRGLHSYAGYEATWVDGVAVVPAQLFNQSTESVPTANTIFWHGLTFGLRFSH